MERPESVGHGGRHDRVDAWEGSVEDDHHGGVASLGGQGVFTKKGQEGKGGSSQSHGKSYDDEANLEAQPS